MNRRLGFVDHLLDNWHANVYVEAIRNQLKSRGFVVTGCTGTERAEAERWAGKHNVAYFSSVQEMNEHVDAYVILAPSNPEMHLEMCQRVLPTGKPTFVDKTFAPNTAIAREIFALADRHQVPIQTSSALRYTNVQLSANQMGSVQHMIAWGAGSSFGEYAIHVAEMIVSCMGAGARKIMRRGTDECSQLLIDFSDGRTAVGNVYLKSDTPFAASLSSHKQTIYVAVDLSNLYTNAIGAMLDFFEKSMPNVPREESLMIRRILDAAELPEARHGFIEIP